MHVHVATAYVHLQVCGRALVVKYDFISTSFSHTCGISLCQPQFNYLAVGFL